MKTIPLTNGVSVIVDESDYSELMKWEWCANKGAHNKHFYASRGERHDGRVTRVFMHRQIVGAKKGDRVKFRNKDPLDCRRENLVYIPLESE